MRLIIQRQILNLPFFVAILIIQMYGAPGDLDRTFSADGRVTTPGGDALSLAIQADGKIVAAGYTATFPNRQILLVRYNRNGSLDRSFGQSGVVTADFGDLDSSVSSVAIQTDGKIIAAGSSGEGHVHQFALIRLNSDGSLDPSFGDGGKVKTQIGQDDYAEAIIIQLDGKIVVTGWGQGYGVIVRYNSNGTLDTSFDGDGKVIKPNHPLITVTLQPDSKIVAAGGRYWFIGISRYNADGSPDPSFGLDGGHQGYWFPFPPCGGCFPGSEIAVGLKIQPDGKMVMVGEAQDLDLFYTPGIVARLNANGSLDTSFGAGGWLFTENGFLTSDLAIQENGKILVSDLRDFRVRRYHSNGLIDTAYGINGTAIVDFGGQSVANGVALDSLERAVTVGWCSQGIAVARLLGDIAVPQPALFDFDGDGKSDISVFRPSDSVWYLNRSSGGFTATQFGLSTDTLAPADYDGDGKTDIAVFRDGVW